MKKQEDVIMLARDVVAFLQSDEGQAVLKQNARRAAEATESFRKARIIPQELIHCQFGPADGSRSWAEYFEHQRRLQL